MFTNYLPSEDDIRHPVPFPSQASFAKLCATFHLAGPAAGKFSSSLDLQMSGAGKMALVSPGADGLQVWEGGNTKATEWKQLVVADGPQRNYEDKFIVDVPGGPPGSTISPGSGFSKPVEPTSKPPRSKWRWIIGVALILLLTLAIATPVGVLVSRNKKFEDPSVSTAFSNSHIRSPAQGKEAPSSPVSSTNAASEGVLRGTRLTTMEPRTGGDIDLFYQNADGSLHYISQSQARIWQGSFDLNVSDAKLGTPLCSTYSNWGDGSVYVSPDSAEGLSHLFTFRQWWLFYIDKANVIQNLYSQSDPTNWRRGDVGDKLYKVPDQSNVAFTVSRGRRYNDTKNDLYNGLSLYTSDEGGRFREYIYADEDESWSDGYTFPRNTNGLGPASIFSESRDAYLFNVNSDNAIQMWWRRYDNNTDPLFAEDSTWHLGPTTVTEASAASMTLLF
ncbi:MAG: hypothetical protein L6R40_006286 [Gallowayella cf. fulva]|nr:MAG: hypothetical protein L6R40_006286 [Xanthomendoza cf. fulva]